MFYFSHVHTRATHAPLHTHRVTPWAPLQAAERGEEGDGESAEDVCGRDPLAALLRMGLLQRLRHILELQLATAPGVAAPCMALLMAVARAGEDSAMALARLAGGGTGLPGAEDFK